MTEQVEELSRGDALARVAVLEAEVAELRKRVCVPDVATREMKDAALAELERQGFDCQDFVVQPVYQAMIAAAPAPVERVDLDHDAIALEKARNIMQIMYGETPRGGSTQLLAMVQVCVLEAMSHVCTPQPAPTAAQDVAGLVEALQSVEWVWSDGSPTKEPDYYCPCCDQPMHQGHSDDCKLDSCVAAHQSGGAR